jgi:ketosteroid isomerase-like protein
MSRHTPEEEHNIAVTERLFDTTNAEDKALLFSEDAVWWNGLPFVGATPGETEHKGRDAIRAILTGATSGPTKKKANTGVDAYDVSTIRN